MEQMNDNQKRMSDELDLLLDQLSWSCLKKVIFESRYLMKAATAGGVRIKESNRKIILKAARSKCLEKKILLFFIFTAWFNEQKEYYDCLEPFFQSEEHKQMLKERGCSISEYVISNEYFNSFVSIIKPDDVDKFLLLSPIRFTENQKSQLELIKENSKDGNENSGEEILTQGNCRTKQSKGICLTKGECKHHKKELKRSGEKIKKLERELDKLREKQKNNSREKTELRLEADRVRLKLEDKITLLRQEKKSSKRKSNWLSRMPKSSL